MKFAESLKLCRETNGLTQDAVAHALSISRQSVSKWENGESYPSIDNLIILRKLFNISIDELIMGEKFLRLPFSVGSPDPVRSHFLKRPLFISSGLTFMILIVTGSLIWSLVTFIGMLLLTIFFFYTLAVELVFQRWILEKQQLRYLPEVNRFKPSFKRMIAILKKRENEQLLPLKYSDINEIELIYEKNLMDVYKSGLIRYNLTPLFLLSMKDHFYFLVTTKTGEKIRLDLSIDCSGQRLAYNHLTEICHFFQQKGLTLKDPLNIQSIQGGGYRLQSFIYDGIKEPLSHNN